MKRNFTKLISIALLLSATFIYSGCSKDDDSSDSVEVLSTQTVENLIAIFAKIDVLDEDGALVDSVNDVRISVEDEDNAIDVVEYLVDGSFDYSGEKVTLSDGVSYVNIVKSSSEGLYYTITFNLSGVEEFKAYFALEEYYNSENMPCLSGVCLVKEIML